MTPVQGLGLVWGTPRTHQGREVRIPQFVATELAQHVTGRQPGDLVLAGIRYDQSLRVSTFRAAFSAAANANGLPDLHLHQLRATAASLAIASGADVKVIQQMLGRSSATMTLDTDGHLLEDRLDEIGSAMDAARAKAQARQARHRSLPDVAPALPEPDLAANAGAAPRSVSAAQDVGAERQHRSAVRRIVFHRMVPRQGGPLRRKAGCPMREGSQLRRRATQGQPCRPQPRRIVDTDDSA